MKIDLHGLNKEDAEIKLRTFMDNLSINIFKVEVIHGKGDGILKQMVSEFYHSRIKEKQLSISNSGITIFYI